MGLVTIIVLFFPDKIAYFVGARGEVLEIASEYLYYVSWGFMAMVLASALDVLIMNDGNPSFIMKVNIFSTVLKIDFTEYVEVKDNKNKEVILIPKGKFVCYDIIFKNDDIINWKTIVDYINEILLENSLESRDEMILFLNKDNLNFNFNDSRRFLSIQVPVK